MTRASTSAANFGLLLVALVLMLHSVVGELIPTQVRHHLSPREYRIDNCVNKLTPENEKYKLRCGPGSDPKHTCFTHWAGDLTSAQACPRLEPFGIPDKILVRDDSMKIFTIDKPGDPFRINYPNQGGVQFFYDNFDPKTGCKDITVTRGHDKAWRLWISDQDGKKKGLDTGTKKRSTARLCTKWIYIFIKRDG
ncbi:hypothetical protein NDA11_007135 [Ustilago hordei]|uniref:Related to Mig1 protein, induced during biotrophic phase n=1 Tax=Ustilago hordei TaxID=120017 RepID=I2FPY9_USTHO|nr:uncharacterized protein UHO2_04703 [Ustilago hordei]KAJ1041743.1 hypothetical protein NDA10_002846 [Ustilago hordei]KAJ1575382.1 hypothetical protein NDA15_000869 [Ustilago hordei]KAJ1577351.1 hypothetical protein NDA12_006803 [Ustilago hordei]KAJ1595268.1 hypothetical protein NDA11_007135 [Ustilago hordei]KAJ1596997.1 hypothetical protein NDA14_002864 [Ustilago hordei]